MGAGAALAAAAGRPGTPPPLPEARPPAPLQTRGILTWVTDATPGAFHPDIQYTTVAGRFIQVGASPRGQHAGGPCWAGAPSACGPGSAEPVQVLPVSLRMPAAALCAPGPCSCSAHPLVDPRAGRAAAGPRHLAAARGGRGVPAGLRRRRGLGRRRGARALRCGGAPALLLPVPDAPACAACGRVACRQQAAAGRSRGRVPSLTSPPHPPPPPPPCSAPGGRASDHDRGRVPLAAGRRGRAAAGERGAQLGCVCGQAGGIAGWRVPCWPALAAVHPCFLARSTKPPCSAHSTLSRRRRGGGGGGGGGGRRRQAAAAVVRQPPAVG